MSPDQRDPIALLEARIAELERARARPMRLTRRLAILVLAAALMLPAGVVLANHQFSDVPPSHQFHNAISAIADAGITTGCGGNRYCPNGLVTRGQMAAFLSRLGALQPGSAPKVNADRVDGFHGTELLVGTATIPPGTTITGFGIWDEAIIDDNEDYYLTVQFPARAPQNLTFLTVNFAPDALASDGDATCTGTASAPTAPPGKVCIYRAQSSRVDALRGFAMDQVPGFADRGFIIVFDSDGGSAGADMYVRYAWAYTAPSS